MDKNNLINLIDDNLNSHEENEIEIINELINYLNYRLRLIQLSNNEKQDFIYCNEGYPLTNEQRKTLKKNKNNEDYYFEMWARATYFRKCAWLNYLNGNTNEKPPIHK